MWNHFLDHWISSNNEHSKKGNLKKVKQIELQQYEMQVFDNLEIINERSLQKVKKRNQFEIEKINIQHRSIISNLEKANNAEVRNILNKPMSEIVHLQQSRQHLENLIKMGRVRLEQSLTKQAGDIIKIRSQFENDKSQTITQLRKNQLTVLRQIRLEQFNTLEKHRRVILSRIIPVGVGEFAIYDLRIKHEYLIQGIRIRQEDTILELRIKQEENMHKLMNQRYSG